MGAATEPDPYIVLGVARSATDAQIREAYRTLGARYHPDRHQGNPLEELASAKMAEINRAYEILSDPRRRAAFDTTRADGFSAGPAAGSGFGTTGPANRRGTKVVLVLTLFLPLLFRFGGLLVRGLMALGRELIEGLTLMRGTPFVLLAVLVACALLVFTLLRRRRRR